MCDVPTNCSSFSLVLTPGAVPGCCLTPKRAEHYNANQSELGWLCFSEVNRSEPQGLLGPSNFYGAVDSDHQDPRSGSSGSIGGPAAFRTQALSSPYTPFERYRLQSDGLRSSSRGPGRINTDDERFAAYVEQQLDPGSIDDSDLDSRLAGFPTLQKSGSELWTEHLLGAGGDYRMQSQPFHESAAAVFVRAAHSERQLVQVLSDFWFNHFNVFPEDVLVRSVFSHYEQDVIRAHVLGNFREMLEAVATSPAMLFYLDNVASRNSGPNENFSRELFELHTLGSENYLAWDFRAKSLRTRPAIRSAMWTLMSLRRLAVSPDAPSMTMSVRFSTVAIGTIDSRRTCWTYSFRKISRRCRTGRDLLDVLAGHPGTARHITRKLCRRLVSDNPSARLVEEAAAVFSAAQDAPDQLAQVVRSILLSSEFRSTWGGKVKRPFEVILSFLRALGTDLNLLSRSHPDFGDDPVSTGIKFLMPQTGNAPFAWQTPDGYPDTQQDWLGAASLIQGWRLMNYLLNIRNENEVLWFDAVADTPADLRSANALAGFWILRLLGRAMRSDDRLEIVAFMAQGRDPDIPLNLAEDVVRRRLRTMIGLIAMFPVFYWR